MKTGYFTKQDYKNRTAVNRVLCKHFKITQAQLMHRDRNPRLTLIRFMAYYLMQKAFRYSSVAIGGLYDRDHTTIGHGLRRAELLKLNERIDGYIPSLKAGGDNFGDNL